VDWPGKLTEESNHAKAGRMKHMIAVLIPLALLACSPAPDAAGPEADPAAPPNPYAFEVSLALTPRAAEKLAATKERVIVDAAYFGAAISETAPGVDDYGQEIGLGGDMIEVDPVNALVKAPGTGFNPTHIASIKGEPEVLVNVYSARKTHTDNIISCGIYQGPVKMAQKQPLDIRCDLIYDENGDPLPPPT
jgi:hypothetical protein